MTVEGTAERRKLCLSRALISHPFLLTQLPQRIFPLCLSISLVQTTSKMVQGSSELQVGTGTTCNQTKSWGLNITLSPILIWTPYCCTWKELALLSHNSQLQRMESSSQFHLMLFLESSVIGRISFHFVFSAISEWAPGVPVSMQRRAFPSEGFTNCSLQSVTLPKGIIIPLSQHKNSY